MTQARYEVGQMSLEQAEVMSGILSRRFGGADIEHEFCRTARPDYGTDYSVRFVAWDRNRAHSTATQHLENYCGTEFVAHTQAEAIDFTNRYELLSLDAAAKIKGKIALLRMSLV